MKVCKVCGKSFKERHYNQTLCSDECKIKSKKEVRAKYKKTEKGLESTKRWQKSERFKNNEKIYRQKPQAKAKAVERTARHIKKNTEAKNNKKRGDSIYQKTRKHSLKDWWLDESKYGCRACGSKENLTVDHIIPKTKGGTDDTWNLQCLCKTCNSKKGNRSC